MDVKRFSQLSEKVEQQSLVSRLKEMISIKSENPFDEAPREGYREKEMGEYLAGQMSALDKGGVQVNTVPDCCSLEVDRRTLPGESKEGVYAEFRSRLDKLVSENPAFRYEITEPSWLIPPNGISVDEPVVQALLTAYRQVIGRDTDAIGFMAGTDAPHMGFPTVVCGPGSINQAHSTCEFVAVDQLIAATQMYLWATMELLN